MLEPPIVEVLDRLTHADARVRWSVSLVLGRLAKKVDGGTLREIAMAVLQKLSHREAGVRSSAAVVLARLGPVLDDQTMEESVSALLNGLNDPAAEVRTEAARALGELGTRVQSGSLPLFKKTVKAMIKQLKDPETTVRGAGLIALGELGMALDPDQIAEVTGIFMEYLRNGQAALRMNAAWGLAKISPLLNGRPAARAMEALKTAEAKEINPDARYHLQDAQRALQHSIQSESNL